MKMKDMNWYALKKLEGSEGDVTIVDDLCVRWKYKSPYHADLYSYVKSAGAQWNGSHWVLGSEGAMQKFVKVAKKQGCEIHVSNKLSDTRLNLCAIGCGWWRM